MIRALAFDLDGTLVDSVADLALAIDAMLAEMGQLPVGEAKVRTWVGNGIENLVQRALWRAMDGPALDEALVRDALGSFRRHYANCLGEASTLYPGVRSTLNTLQQFGVPMALITNKAEEFTLPLLEQLALAPYFSLVLSGDSLTEKKPHPAPLRAVMARFELTADQVLMVGDSRSDVQAARAAECPVVALSYGYNHGQPIALSAPDAVFNDFSQLLLWLDDKGSFTRQDKALSINDSDQVLSR